LEAVPAKKSDVTRGGMIIPMPDNDGVGWRISVSPEVITLLGWVVRDARSPLVLDMISTDEVFG
jgi:hypothetical protein